MKKRTAKLLVSAMMMAFVATTTLAPIGAYADYVVGGEVAQPEGGAENSETKKIRISIVHDDSIKLIAEDGYAYGLVRPDGENAGKIEWAKAEDYVDENGQKIVTLSGLAADTMYDVYRAPESQIDPSQPSDPASVQGDERSIRTAEPGQSYTEDEPETHETETETKAETETKETESETETKETETESETETKETETESETETKETETESETETKETETESETETKETETETKETESKETETETKAETETKKPETKETETKKPETKETETKKPETKETESKKPETKKPETKKPETKKPEREPIIHPFAGSYVTGLADGQKYAVGTTAKIVAVGNGMENVNPVKGDNRWRPYSWDWANGQIYTDWDDGYTVSFSLKYAGDYKLNVAFERDDFINGKWVASGVLENYTIHFSVVQDIPADVFQITAISGANGSVSPSGTIAVTAGKDQTFTFTPNSGFVIARVFADGQDVTNQVKNNTYTFTNVKSNHAISVAFEHPDRLKPPATGDSMNIGLIAGIMGVSLIVIIALVIFMKKKKS